MSVVSVPEMFGYWLQGGRIDVGFLGAAQIDRHGNLNSTVIGDVRLAEGAVAGGGGAPEIATSVREVFVMLRHSPRSFVERLDFKTSVGESRPRRRHRPRHPRAGRDGELTLTHVHAGIEPSQAVEATGWELRVAEGVRQTWRRRTTSCARSGR